jgi:MFS family permease
LCTITRFAASVEGSPALSAPPAPARDIELFAGRPPVRLDPQRTAPVGWWPAVLVMLIALLDRIETNLVAGALPALQAEWGFSDTWAGAIPGAAAIAGIILLLPAGHLADRANRTKVLAGVVAAWSFITLGSALAPTFAVFFLTRVVLGAADQIDTPAASSLLADYYPPRSRGKVYGLQRMAYFSGLPLGVLLGGVLTQAFGWRSAFLLAAFPGLLIAAGCWALREPIRGVMDRLDPSRPTAPEDAPGPAAITAAAQSGSLIGRMATCLRTPTVRLLCGGMPALFLGLAGIFFWLPSYFERTHGLGEAAAGGITAGIGFVGIVGGITLGAWAGDRWHGRRAGWRITLGGGAMLSGTVAFAVALAVPGLAAQAVLFNLANLLISAALPNLTAAYADVLPATRRGIGFALLQFLLVLGGAMGPLLVGAASDLTGSLATAWYALLVPMLAGSAVILRARRHQDADTRAAWR